MRRVVLPSVPLLLLAAFLAGPVGGAEIAWTNSYAGALKAAAEAKKPLVIDFYSERCSWCVKMDKDVLRDERAVEKLKDFVCLKVNVDKDARTAAAFQVASIPRMVVVDPEGGVAADRLGYQPLQDFLVFLEEAKQPPLRPGIREPAPGLGPVRDLAAVRSAVEPEKGKAAFSEGFLAYLGHADAAVRAEARRGVREGGERFRPQLLSALGHPALAVRIEAWLLLKEAAAPLPFDPWAPAADREVMRAAVAKKLAPAAGAEGKP